MTKRPFIALEIHSATLWEPSQVLPMIEVMERWGYNALVLHQNDLLDECTQLGLAANYGVTDLRLKKVRGRCAWLNRLVQRLAAFGAELFLEIKEPSFHDYALEFYPDLIGPDGAPDPTHPDWAVMCRAKVEDLLDRVPGVGGLVVNLSSPESRVSLPDHLAAKGLDTDQGRWFDAMIEAFAGPLGATGKRLWVRDFSYTTDMQSDVLAAVARRDDAVGASVKITAHDYFPRAPENPVLRQVEGDMIVEFEAFGEHTGWGVIPNCRVGEFGERMAGYHAAGANGMLVRVSWEAIPGSHAMESLSAVNVFALPRLAAGETDAQALVSAWLEDRFNLTGDLAAKAADLMLQSWEIPASSYWLGEVFPRHSCLPSTWREGWMSMETTGMGYRGKRPDVARDDPRLTDAAREALFFEKEAATALAMHLAEATAELSPQLPEPQARLFEPFAWLPVFARTFEHATKATFFAARGMPDDHPALTEQADALLALADQIEDQLAEAQDLPHPHHVLFDPEQIRRFVRSLQTPA